MTAPLSRDDLDAIAARTLEHYGQRAQSFWEGTRDHDVEQNIASLLDAITAAPPFTILDFGCGPGRDLVAFTRLRPPRDRPRGRARIRVDGPRASAAAKCWEQDFLKLDLPDARFDGIFANAALFHVPKQELPRVLRELHATLKRDGVLFSSNPRGNDEEGWNGGRFGVWHSLDGWRRYVAEAGFAELRHYYRPPGAPARAAAVACERVAQSGVAPVARRRAVGRAGRLPLSKCGDGVSPSPCPLPRERGRGYGARRRKRGRGYGAPSRRCERAADMRIRGSLSRWRERVGVRVRSILTRGRTGLSAPAEGHDEKREGWGEGAIDFEIRSRLCHGVSIAPP